MTEREAPITLAWGAATDTGLRRAINEDAYLAQPPLFIVADGMGGHEAGEVASATAIAAFATLAGRPSVTIDDIAVVLGVATAGVRALAGAGPNSAGTTLTGVAVAEHDGSAYWLIVNLGDSRTYLLADGTLEQISVDHSLVQELVESGELRPAEAALDPRRNVITRAMGAGGDGQAEFWMIPANAGDRVLVCSDGLSGELDHGELAMALLSEPSAQDAATRLVHEALLHGGRDNVTVIVIDALAVIGAEEAVTARRGAPALDTDDTVPRLHKTETDTL